ncbi:MAG: hypothetical protein ABSH28_05395 [Acidobacteriota bacterium]
MMRKKVLTNILLSMKTGHDSQSPVLQRHFWTFYGATGWQRGLTVMCLIKRVRARSGKNRA